MGARTPLGALLAAALVMGAPQPAWGAQPGQAAEPASAGAGTPPPDAGGAAAPAEPPAAPIPDEVLSTSRPPPLHVEYAQVGVALTTEIMLDAGAACHERPEGGFEPCILGSGGGLIIRSGYRTPGPWYFGGAYEFFKADSSNLYRLGIFQQARAELRYMPDIGYRAAPYFSAAVGGALYGNEWGAETGGAVLSLGAGVELEVSRLTVLGLGFAWRPILLAGWTDTAGYQRRTSIAHFLGLELLLEVRTELGRR